MNSYNSKKFKVLQVFAIMIVVLSTVSPVQLLGETTQKATSSEATSEVISQTPVKTGKTYYKPRVTAQDVNITEETTIDDAYLRANAIKSATYSNGDTPKFTDIVITVGNNENGHAFDWGKTPGTYPGTVKVYSQDHRSSATADFYVNVSSILPTITATSKNIDYDVDAPEPTFDEYINLFGIEGYEISGKTEGYVITYQYTDAEGYKTGSIGTVPIRFTITDDDGQTASVDVNLHKHKTNTPPTISVTSPYSSPEGTVLSDEQIIPAFEAVVTDDKEGTIVSISHDPINFDAPGQYPIHFLVEDSEGLTATTTGTLIITDLKPTITNNVNEISYTIGDQVPNWITVFGISATEIASGDLTSQVTVVEPNLLTVGAKEITFNVSDAEGNPATKTLIVNVNRGNDIPEIEVDDLYTINEENDVLTRAELIEWFEVDAEDTEDGEAVTITVSDIPNANTPGEYMITFNVTDSQGATATAKGKLIILDLKPKIYNENSEINYTIGEDAPNWTLAFGITATEITGGDLTSKVTVVEPDLNTVGRKNITFNVADTEGNTATKTLIVNVMNANTKPEITAKQQYIIDERIQAITEHELLTWFAVSATDAEDGNNLTVSISSIPNSNTPNSYSITFSVTDSAGAIAEVTGTLVISDVLPEITNTVNEVNYTIGQDIPNWISAFGISASELASGDLTDNVLVSEIDLTTAGTKTISFLVKDAEGNPAIKVLSVNVNTKPEITAKEQYIMFERTQSITEQELLSWFAVSAADAEDGNNLTVSISSIPNSNTPNSYPITFSVTDSYGVTAEVTGTLVISDVLPEITNTVNEVDYTIGDMIPNWISAFGISATELASGDLTSSVLVSEIDLTSAGTKTIAFLVKDAEGNPAIKVLSVNVNTKPEIIAKQQYIIDERTQAITEHDVLTWFAVSAVDAQDGDDLAVTVTGIPNSNTPGEYTIHFTVTDSKGATATTSGKLVINDLKPVIHSMNNEVVYAIGSTEPNWISAFGITASELTSGDLTSKVTVVVPNLTTAGSKQITFKVVDDEGNVAIKNLIVKVCKVNTKPEITAKDQYIINERTQAISKNDLLTWFDVHVTDAEDGNNLAITLNYIPDSNTPGSYTITFRTVDSDGLSAYTTGKLIIKDLKPVITSELTEINYTIGYSVPNWVHAFGVSASELASGDLTSKVTVTAPSLTTPGVKNITFRVSDIEGNVVTKTLIVKVCKANTRPEITAEDKYTINERTQAITENELLTWFVASAEDAEDGEDLAITVTGIPNSNTPGEYTIHFTVTDSKGLTATTSGTLKIVDVLPTITSVVDEIDYTIGNPVPNWLSAFGISASELASGDLTDDVMVPEVDVTMGETKTIMFQVKDAEGNVATKTVTVNVNTKPEITAKQQYIMDERTQAITENELLTWFVASAEDAEDGEDLAITVTGIPNSNTPGEYTIHFTVTDSKGLTATTSGTLKIVDVLPTITSVVDEIDYTIGNPVPNWLSAFGIIASELASGDLTDDVMVPVVDVTMGGAKTIMFQVKDAEGNVVTKTVTVNVNTKPEITAKQQYIMDERTQAITENELLSWFAVSTNDAEDGNNLAVTISGIPNSNTPGEYTIHFTVTDSRGLTATTYGTLIINNVKPVITTTKNIIALPINGSSINLINEFGVQAGEFSANDLIESLQIMTTVDYQKEGIYSVNLKVVDDENSSAEKEVFIVVGNPIANITLSSSKYAQIPEEIAITLANILEKFNSVAMTSSLEDISQYITINGTYDIHKPGEYPLVISIDYKNFHKQIEVVLEVKDAKPTIDLQRDLIKVKDTSKLKDLLTKFGVTASEINVDDILGKVKIDTSAIISKGGKLVPGLYPVVFSVTDEEGTLASETATVEVEASEPVVPEESEIVVPEKSEEDESEVTVNTDEDVQPSESAPKTESTVRLTTTGSETMMLLVILGSALSSLIVYKKYNRKS